MKLYVGSRDIKPPGYLSVDVDPANRPDIVADIRDMRSVADNSCEEIIASHVLEHLEWPESFKALAEFARVLNSGGVLKVAVPDLSLLLEMVVRGESDFHAAALIFGVGGRTNPFEQHRYGFTERMLRQLLTILGFASFDWWASRLPEGASGWSHANVGDKVAISLNLAARKTSPPMADPAAIYEALVRRPMDDPASVLAELVTGQSPSGSPSLDVSTYQRIHFLLIEQVQRVKYLEELVRKLESRKP